MTYQLGIDLALLLSALGSSIAAGFASARGLRKFRRVHLIVSTLAVAMVGSYVWSITGINVTLRNSVVRILAIPIFHLVWTLPSFVSITARMAEIVDEEKRVTAAETAISSAEKTVRQFSG